jgi:hypothetical protein
MNPDSSVKDESNGVDSNRYFPDYTDTEKAVICRYIDAHYREVWLGTREYENVYEKFFRLKERFKAQIILMNRQMLLIDLLENPTKTNYNEVLACMRGIHSYLNFELTNFELGSPRLLQDGSLGEEYQYLMEENEDSFNFVLK